MRDIIETIGNLIDRQNTAFISSVDADGFPNTKAMLAPVKRDGIKTLWWHTNSSSMRIAQYRNNPKACAYFCDNRFFHGLMLRGTMEVIDDPAVKNDIWQDSFSMYYKGGKDGGDFIILKFTSTSGRYYHDFHSEDFAV